MHPSRILSGLALLAGLSFSPTLPALVAADQQTTQLSQEFLNPPREFSVMPFWFWNDELKDEEILRQIADFEAHGVFGFVIHPRIGLPKDSGWMSPKLLRAMRLAIEEAAKRKMYVILYDEGMYPSGSASGQVVAANPAHAARGLVCLELKDGEKSPALKEGWKVVATLKRPSGKSYAVVDRPTGGVIRGLHFIDEDKPGQLREDTPPAGDILNPEAVASFIHFSYERYAQEFSEYFGKTILGVFTDEPNPLGRDVPKGMTPGSAPVIAQVSKLLGYDITPHLLDLWFDDSPDSAARRKAIRRAINECLEQSYYRQLSEWCEGHGLWLMGHPAESTDIGTERFFHVPGQDLVWRYVEPGPKALEGEHSTMAKCASSAALHLGRRRNANEIYGAYGHSLSFDEVKWLANWCFVRGHNLLYPHAFYYSVRGPRWDERPPDVGPHAAWWSEFRGYADACRRLSWVNTDSLQVCDIAILCDPVELPWQAAKVLYQNQRDFNYLEFRHLLNDAKVDAEGIHIGSMHYKALLVDGLDHVPASLVPKLAILAKAGRLLSYGEPAKVFAFEGVTQAKDPETLLGRLDAKTAAGLRIQPAAPGLRVRHLIKDGTHYVLLVNEETTQIKGALTGLPAGACVKVDPETGKAESFDPSSFELQGHSMTLLHIKP